MSKNMMILIGTIIFCILLIYMANEGQKIEERQLKERMKQKDQEARDEFRDHYNPGWRRR